MSTPEYEAITYTASPEQTASFTADARLYEQALAAQEPGLSRYYNAGELHVPPDMLRQAAEECAALPDAASLAHYQGEQHWMGVYQEASPFLQGFAEAVELRVREFVQETTGTDKEELICTAEFGPYRFLPDNVWHRDSRDPYGRAYLVTLFGKTTEFSLGAYADHQFDIGDLLLPDVPVQNTRRPLNGQVSLHNEASTVHRAPSQRYQGVNRFFVSCLFAKETL